MKILKWIKFKMPAKYDRSIHTSVIVLIVLGTLMISSCSVGDTIENKLVVVTTIVKQIAFVVVAYLCMTNLANHFSIEKIMKYIRIIGFFVIALMIVCLFNEETNGSHSWIYIPLPIVGRISIQPSEFMKVYMIVLMACTVERVKRMKIDCWSIVKVPLSFFLVGVIVLLFIQHDVGTCVVLTLICGLCFLIPSHPRLKSLQKFVLTLFIIMMVVVFLLMSEPGMQLLAKIPLIGEHIIARFQMSANPWKDEYGDGMQLINSLYAFASGGWKGLGLGQSIQKMKYLSEASTDYILAITVEELGIFGFLVILIGYGCIIFNLVKY
ncbi:MAG: FtsW/RodA/SpoVE family cell cycle protein, partial [Traorella sp.]